MTRPQPARGNDANAALVAQVGFLGGVLGLMRRPKYVHQGRAETRFVVQTSHIPISTQANSHTPWPSDSARPTFLIPTSLGVDQRRAPSLHMIPHLPKEQR